MSKNWFIAIVFSLILIMEVILITQFGLKTIDFNILQGSISNNPVINITSPSGGEVLSIGSTQYVKWNSSGVDKVTIYLCAELPGMVCSGISGIPTNGIDARLGEYKYTVPKVDVFSNNQEVIVKIFDADSNYRIYGQSKKFTISDGTNITAKGGVISGLNTVPINKTFSSSGSAYKFQAKPIYSLYVSGSRTISKTDGYARIILTGSNGKQYLVYEAIGPYDSKTSDFDRSCQETCSLNGITPKELKVEVSGASIKIDSIFIAEDKNSVITAKSAQQSSSEKLSKIQEYIRKNNLGWTAGETSVSKMSYEQKRKLLGVSEGKEMPNMQGFEYYTGGVFETGSNKTTSKSPISKLPRIFDWRNRHGENWLTSIKNQNSPRECGSCWAFASTGVLESVANLYFNTHLNLDLSEQDLMACFHYNTGCDGLMADEFNSLTNYISANGICSESCFPYTATNQNCSKKCQNFENTIVKNTSAKWIDINDEEKLKEILITKGPLYAGGTLAIPSHAMILVGYDTDPDGMNIWIFKNSWGNDWGESGYIRTVSLSGFLIIPELYYLETPITISNPGLKIRCADEDKDKYCNWGISQEIPNTCPAYCKPERDCDDSNGNLVRFDENYNCISLGPNSADTNPPKVGKLIPENLENTFYIGRTYRFKSRIQDDQKVSGCQLMFDGFAENLMILDSPNCANCYAQTEVYVGLGEKEISLFARCWDEAGNVSEGEILKINLVAPPAGIVIEEIKPQNAVINLTQKLSAQVSDDEKIIGCSLLIDDADVGNMKLSLSPCKFCTASKDYTFSSAGFHNAQVVCSDNLLNFDFGSKTFIKVSSGFSVEKVSPLITYTKESTKFISSVTSANKLVACILKVDGRPVGDYMNISESYNADYDVWIYYTFNKKGKYSVSVRCMDKDSNIAESVPVKITVNDGCPKCVSYKDFCESDKKCEKDCGADAKCDEKSTGYTWISNNICYSCSNCKVNKYSVKPSLNSYSEQSSCYFNCKLTCGSLGWTKNCDRDLNKQCSDSVCTNSGWNNSKCGLNNNGTSTQYLWNPCVPGVCNSRNSCGYAKLEKTTPCPKGKTVVTGKCVAMPKNKVVASYKNGNGWYCKFACDNGTSLCFVTDGCAYVQCI